MRPLLSIFALLIFCACSTTQIQRKPEEAAEALPPRTHHIALFGFWEVSDPINLKAACGGRDWRKIQTGFAPMNVLVGVVTLGLYTPATVHISCEARN